MKKMMIMGGMTGFGIGVITGYLKEVSLPETFLRACVCALFSGLLFRWWGRMWFAGLRDTLAIKAAEKQSGPTVAIK
jgi:hypothetical protein